MLNTYIFERTKNIPFYVRGSLCKFTSLIRYAHFFFRKWLQYLYSYMNQMRSVFPYILWKKKNIYMKCLIWNFLLWKMMVIYVKSSNKRYKLKKNLEEMGKREREKCERHLEQKFLQRCRVGGFTVQVLILNLRFRRVFCFICCISFLNLAFCIHEIMLFI